MLRRVFCLTVMLLGLTATIVSAQENPFDPGGGGGPPPSVQDEWTDTTTANHLTLILERFESIKHEHETPQDSSPNVYSRVSTWRARTRDNATRATVSQIRTQANTLEHRHACIGALIKAANGNTYENEVPLTYMTMDDNFAGWKAACDALATPPNATAYNSFLTGIDWYETEIASEIAEVEELKVQLMNWDHSVYEPFPPSMYLTWADNIMAQIDLDLGVLKWGAETIYDHSWHTAVQTQNNTMNANALAQLTLDWQQYKWDELQLLGVWVIGPTTPVWW